LDELFTVGAGGENKEINTLKFNGIQQKIKPHPVSQLF
jgi:hypothetical protein